MVKQTIKRTGASPAAKAVITINGKQYDAHKGHAVDPKTRTALPKTRSYGGFDIKPATGIHAGPSRSQTLRRGSLAKPVVARPVISHHGRTILAPGVSVAPAKRAAPHPMVSRFGSTTASKTVTKPAPVKTPSITRTPALVKSAAPVSAQPKKYVTMSEAITAKAIAQAPTHKQKAAAHKAAHKTNKQVESSWKRVQKRIRPTPPLIITGAIIVVLIAGVISYLSIPALSLFIAARSAGVSATYPNYIPDGYSFAGPVTYHDGDVSMKFTANGSSKSFMIDQRSSYWDSGAVLDNYVLARSQNYLTYSQSGITVYTFGSSAAWMNAGVLHTIDGNAPLTSDQILRIAGSM